VSELPEDGCVAACAVLVDVCFWQALSVRIDAMAILVAVRRGENRVVINEFFFFASLSFDSGWGVDGWFFRYGVVWMSCILIAAQSNRSGSSRVTTSHNGWKLYQLPLSLPICVAVCCATLWGIGLVGPAASEINCVCAAFSIAI